MKPTFLSIMSGIAALALLGAGVAFAESPYQSSADFAKFAEKLRESALLHLEPQVIIPTAARTMVLGTSMYPWKTQIVTTIFWVGENSSVRNPVDNHRSCWDANWEGNFGGFDDPDTNHRANFIPKNFVPKLNPFYFALPYTDVLGGQTRPEAPTWIPWFKNAFVRSGQSVCKDRWIAIRNQTGRICYAQWSDCGPFRSDHYQYVFGPERPKPNLNMGAGLDVSPAVRDYLGLGPIDYTDWRFVEFHEVASGPWALYGENNPFVQQRRGSIERVASATGTKTPPGAAAAAQSTQESSEPTVLLK